MAERTFTPAFPIVGRDGRIQHGMSLRDYFAAKALTGVLQARALINGGDSLNSQEDVAEECYELADAMLAEREK
jgi:hypothetical protein